MSTTGLVNLSAILQRLEAATSRLEDIVIAQASSPTAAPTEGASASASAVPPAAGAAAGASRDSGAPTPTSVNAWDEAVSAQLSEFEALSAGLGDAVAEQVACTEVRKLIGLASRCRRPAGGLQDPAYMARLSPLQDALQKVIAVRDDHRGDRAIFNHLSTVSEGVPALAWVAVEPAPGPFITDMKDSAQFYANRVLKEFKDQDPLHAKWARAFMALLDAVREYVVANHRTGLVWTSGGVELASLPEDIAARSGESAPSTEAAAGASAGGAPPPPPPPAPAPSSAPAAEAAASATGMDAVLSQINQGEGITSGLRRVDKSAMTHKNPELRAGGTVGEVPTRPSAAAAKVAAAPPAAPPTKKLDGNKWTVENYTNNAHVVIDETDIGQTVFVYHCENCVVEVKGKVNAVSMLGCKKTSLLLDTLVSSLEVTRCQSFAAQVLGHTPTILIEKTDGGQVYLPATGVDTDIITSQSSALNVSVPAASGEPGDMVEVALPEQLRHSIKRAGSRTYAVSEAVQHAG